MTLPRGAWETVSHREPPSRNSLAETLKDPHAPETGAARNLLDMAVLPEIFGLDIITGGQAAAGTVGVIIGEHVRAKRAEIRIIPGIQDSPLGQVAEHFRLHLL